MPKVTVSAEVKASPEFQAGVKAQRASTKATKATKASVKAKVKAEAKASTGLAGRGTPAHTRPCTLKNSEACTGTLFDKGTPYRVAGTEVYKVGLGFCRTCAKVAVKAGTLTKAQATPAIATKAQADKVRQHEAPKASTKAKAKASTKA